MADAENAIVIGIDFGTTFSGVSWAFSGQPNDIEVITRWEAELNFASDTEKTPTAIRYRGAQGSVSWGYGIPVEEISDAMRWFKLLLVDETDLPENLRTSSQIATARKMVKAENKDPVDVISSYIRHLWNHSIECIGISAGNELVKLCRFHIVGDHFVVCDAGGGTVDLISYEVLSLKPMVVREVIKGDGDLCGGVFLDEAFINLIKEKVTPQAWRKVPKDEAANVLNGDWEHGIKQQFDGQVRDWHIKLPPECVAKEISQRGIKRKRNLILNLQDLLPVFEPIAKRIGSLVQKQIDGVRAKSGKLPKHSWTAICRGAVIQGLSQQNLSSGLSVSVRSRIARASYGTTYTADFVKKKHSASSKTWREDEQKWVANNQMDWFLEQVIESLYVSSAWPPPTEANSTVKELCRITWNKMIDFETLPRYVNPIGKVFQKLVFEIDMTCAGGSIDFSVLHNGKHVGAKNVSVVFDAEEDDLKREEATRY
ncbi:hypothetical protein ColLi_03286 [Colletotrichum liriopes]|uniref:Hsp70-like protein n=1 Tax=Colletotrichum liriopes TaxID=708192 RepID=A0AA37GGE4_9PEZI|nr:hypothetical protein ColLi_03286 [Colletotrichum liriopes]